MSDKTTVTKTDVSGSSDSQADEGKIQQEKEIENRVRENLRTEYERKLTEHSAAKDAEINELKNKVGELTAAEERRLSGLESEKAQIEAELKELDSRQDLRAFRTKIEREAAKVKAEVLTEAEHKALTRLAVVERAKVARAEGITEEALIKELNVILKGRWVDEDPLTRLQLALEDRAERKAVSADREELKRLKAEREGFSESGTRKLPERKPEELRQAHISGDVDAGIARAKALDQRQKDSEK